MANALRKEYASFREFYPVYLNEHANRACRELHFTGSTLAIFCLGVLLLSGNLWWLAGAFGCGYGFSWIGHFVFAKNQPVTLRHPIYSFMADWLMYWQMLTGQASF